MRVRLGARTALAPGSGPGRSGQAGAGPTLLEETRSQVTVESRAGGEAGGDQLGIAEMAR